MPFTSTGLNKVYQQKRERESLWKPEPVHDLFMPNIARALGRLILGETGDFNEFMTDLAPYPEQQMFGQLAPAQIAQKLPTGMVKNPGAYLHRAIGKTGELQFLDNLIKKGAKSDVASTMIVPEARPMFRGSYAEPWGVVFSPRDPKNIKAASHRDIGSRYNIKGRGLGTKEWKEPKDWVMPTPFGDEIRFPAGEAPEMWFARLDAGGAFDNLPKKEYDWLADLSSEDVMEKGYPVKSKWMEEVLFPHEKRPLSEMLREQQARAYDLPSERHYDLINEIIYSMGDPNEIRGIRAPRNWERMLVPDQVQERDLPQAMMEFAKQRQLPIFQYELPKTSYEVYKGLTDYLEPWIQPKHEWYKISDDPSFPHGLIETTADPLARLYRR